MKRFLALIIAGILIFSMVACLSGCGSDDDKCPACNGTGYYQKKDCPLC